MYLVKFSVTNEHQKIRQVFSKTEHFITTLHLKYNKLNKGSVSGLKQLPSHADVTSPTLPDIMSQSYARYNTTNTKSGYITPAVEKFEKVDGAHTCLLEFYAHVGNCCAFRRFTCTRWVVPLCRLLGQLIGRCWWCLTRSYFLRVFQEWRKVIRLLRKCTEYKLQLKKIVHESRV